MRNYMWGEVLEATDTIIGEDGLDCGFTLFMVNHFNSLFTVHLSFTVHLVYSSYRLFPSVLLVHTFCHDRYQMLACLANLVPKINKTP
jgi:hypothetical protein